MIKLLYLTLNLSVEALNQITGLVKNLTLKDVRGEKGVYQPFPDMWHTVGKGWVVFTPHVNFFKKIHFQN